MWEKLAEEWQYWYWAVIALACLGLEMALPGVAFLWIAVGAFILCGMALLFPIFGLGLQLIIFSVMSTVLVYISHKYIKKNDIASDRPHLSNKSAQYIGNFYDLIEPIENGIGKIKAGDSLWRVEGEDMPTGTRVVVTGCKGATFTVEKAEPGAPVPETSSTEEETNEE